MRDCGEKTKAETGQKPSSLSEIVVARVLPTWCALGRTDFGGPADPGGSLRLPDKGPLATLRVQAQMVSARAKAASSRLGTKGASSFPAYLATLLAHFLSPDGEPGLARVVAATGEVLDSRRALEDHAWMLRALADSYVATGSRDILLVADLILEFIDRHLANNSIGYFEDNQGCGERRQSSHAHLLDAILTLQAATGSRVYLARAADLVELFRFHLLDRVCLNVGEVFDRSWRAVPPARSAIFSPASAARWIVLLHRHHLAAGDEQAFELMQALGRRLLAQRDGGGMIASAIDASGAVRDRSLQLRDQLWLGAALQALGRGGEAGQLESRIGALFIDPAPTGCWFERVGEDRCSLGDPISMETLAALVGHAADAQSSREFVPESVIAMHAA